jgi:hypothetical protein
MAGDAGGIYNAGTSIISGSQIHNNRAEVLEGGGILNKGVQATLSIINCDIYENFAADTGGGIDNEGGKVDIVNSKVFQNGHLVLDGFDLFTQEGAGIFNAGSMNIKSSKVFGNEAGWIGGGIVNYDDPVNDVAINLIDSLVYGNAALYGGGIANDGAFGTGMVTVTNSQIYGNTAYYYGGGVWNSASTLVLNSGSIDHNTANAIDPLGSGGGIFNQGTITGNTDIVHDNTPDDIV